MHVDALRQVYPAAMGRSRSRSRSYSPARGDDRDRDRDRGGSHKSSSGSREPCSLLIHNLSRSVTVDDLRYYTERHGALRDIYIPKDYHTKEPRGIAFVEYTNSRDCEEAKHTLDKMVIQGREIGVCYAQHGRKRHETYIKGSGGGGGGYGGGGGGGGGDYRGGGGRDRDRGYDRDRDRGGRNRGYDRERDRDRRRSRRDRDRSESRERSDRRRSRSRDRGRDRSPSRSRSRAEIHVAVHGTSEQDSFLRGSTLELVARYFKHDVQNQGIHVKMLSGRYTLVQLTTPLSRLRQLRADGDGSQDRPFYVQIERSEALGAGAGAGGNAGDAGSRLETIDETTTKIFDRLKELDQMKELMFELEMRMTHAPGGGNSHGTISELGNSIKDMAVKEELVRVTPAGQQLATAWLNTAGDAGAAFKRATEVQSQMPERSLVPGRSLQKVVSAFIKAKDWGQGEGRRMWDTHDTCSVCGDSLNPDIVISNGADKPLPSSTVAVVDIKRQDAAYDSGANVHQLAQFGAALFNQLPPTSRTFLLLGVTNLKTITFLGMTRGENNTFSYKLSSAMPNVLDVLCSILASTDAGADDARGNMSIPPQFGAMEPPHLTFNGQRLRLLSVLGLGATATVYECTLQLQDEWQLAAAKVLNNPVAATGDVAGTAGYEVVMLERLTGCPGIVRLVGALDDDRGLLLQPVGKTMVRLREPQERQNLFRGMEGLLSSIRSMHERGVVHRDLRNSNLLVVEDKDGDAVLVMDWGFAVLHANGDAPQFAGALLCASDRVLEALESGLTPQPEFADDLETLVKSLFLLLHPPLDNQLHRLATPPPFGDVRKFWASVFEARPSWQDILSLARARNYDALGKALRGKFE